MNQKPNILFVLTDDQGAWAMHCAGTTDIQTPNLDRLSNEGIRFENFYCSSPVCSPARASILTGKMPSAHGVHDWLCGGNLETSAYPNMKDHERYQTPDHAIAYLAGHRTYIEELAKAGYWCALSGKWHAGDSVHPSKGFAGWFTIGGGGCRYYHADTVEDGTITDEHRYITDVITDRALRFLQERPKESPFYLSVHYTAPHSPWTEENHPKEFLDLYRDCAFESVPSAPLHPKQITTCPIGDTEEKRRENLRGYFAAISAMDAGVGRILDYMEQEGLLENTLVVFTADNGMNLGQHGVWGKGNGTYPPNMYDSSVKVPFIVRLPGAERGGQVTQRVAKHCDIFPTMLDVAGLPVELEKEQPGQSLLPFLLGQDTDSNGDVFICDEYGFVRMYRTNHYKLVRTYLDNWDQFYDLQADPGETHNLIDEPDNQKLIAEMTEKLDSFFETCTISQNSGKKLPVSGRGQYKLCYEKEAFVPLNSTPQI